MRILHTADWHLGRSLCGRPLHEEQAFLLTGAFVDIARDCRPDVIVVAGDIYDRSVPPADSVELLGDVLQTLVRDLRIPVVLIAGNHDDQRRLSFAAPLLRESGLFIADSPIGTRLRFADAHGPVSILAADYGSPELVATMLADEPPCAEHDAAFAGVMRNLRGQVPAGERSVVVAHAFVHGGLPCDSERVLVGNAGAVSAAHLDDFNYVALGHLHRPQEVAGHVRYAGSLLPYSFSEAGQAKSVTLVEIDADGTTRLRPLDLPVRSPLRTLRGTLDEVLARLHAHRADWLQVVLTDRPFDAIARLRERHPMVLDLRFETPSAPDGALPPAERAARDPMQALAAFWQAVRGEALPEDAMADLLDATRDALDAEA